MMSNTLKWLGCGALLVLLSSGQSYSRMRQQWYLKLQWPNQYQQSYYDSGLDKYSDGLDFYQINPNLTLVQVQTYLGAYQPAFIYMLYEPKTGAAYLLQLPFVGGNSLFTQTEVAGLSSFNPREKTLEIYSKSRGPGGCGIWGRWKFLEHGVKLVEMRSQSCETADAQGDNMILNPRKWPKVWPRS